MQSAIEATAGRTASLAGLAPTAICACTKQTRALHEVGVRRFAALQGAVVWLDGGALNLASVEVVDDNLIDLALPLVAGVGPLFRAEVLLEVLCGATSDATVRWSAYGTMLTLRYVLGKAGGGGKRHLQRL